MGRARAGGSEGFHSADEGRNSEAGLTAASAIEASAAHPSQLVLMNGFSLCSGGAIRRLPASAQRLLAFVALQGRSVSRRRAAFTLWPDASEARAYGSLRTALFRLRAVCPDGSVLECGREFELSANVEVDVRKAYELAARLERPGTCNTAELESLLEGGELLPDWYEDWVLVERERFHELRRRAPRGGKSRRSARPPQAIPAGSSALGACPVAPLRRARARSRRPLTVR